MSAAGWSTKVTPMSKNKTSNTEANKYLYLYTCEQREMADGTLAYTTVLLDDSTTIIDGGNIITGTVTANQLNALNINASNMLTIGAFQENTQNDILNSNIQVGGRNLLRNTAISRIEKATQYGAWDILKPTYSNPYLLDLDEGEYVLSFDWEADSALPGSFYVWIGYGNTAGTGSAEMPGSSGGDLFGNGETSGHVVRKFTWPDANDTYPYFACRPFRDNTSNVLSGITFTITNAKLERGSVPTDWSPAPEDTDAAISDVQDNLNATRSWYAECSTAVAEANKTATITPATTDFTLSAGATVYVKFTATNSAAVTDLTMNINNTGAKPLKTIRYDNINNIANANYLRAGITLQLYYDGTN